jgi:hypothetical protein
MQETSNQSCAIPVDREVHPSAGFGFPGRAASIANAEPNIL